MSYKSDDLEGVYEAASADKTRKLYDDWAQTYDADNFRKGFRLPGLGAAYAARYLPVGAEAILDAGCGTGLVGESLSALGYGDIIGCDLSPEMLTVAATWDVYSALDLADLGKKLAYPDDRFAAFTCFGSFGPGHAPPHSLRELVRVTRPGGLGLFNLREDTYRDQGFEDEMNSIETAGAWRQREVSPKFRPYLAGEPNLFGRIFVFEIL